MKEIYLAGGCFWALEHYFNFIDGICETEVGYINGFTRNPRYHDVCKGSGHAEAVHIVYNPRIISLEKLLEYYYDVINPTTYQRQGDDAGVQYRTGIYYVSRDDVEVIVNSLERLQSMYLDPIVIELEAVHNFKRAEEYHQDFLKKNPFGYCQIPKEVFKNVEMESYKISKEDYDIIKGYKREKAFKNKYYDFFDEGIYVDIKTKIPLFSSSDKYDSESGYPSFTKVIDENEVIKKLDLCHLMFRASLIARESGNHLGYVFNDGPLDKGGKRYCVNSAALKFIPKEKLKEKGYGEYLKYIK